jgi:hypothetical protein
MFYKSRRVRVLARVFVRVCLRVGVHYLSYKCMPNTHMYVSSNLPHILHARGQSSLKLGDEQMASNIIGSVHSTENVGLSTQPGNVDTLGQDMCIVISAYARNMRRKKN